MKIILTKNIPNIGQAGEVKDVSDGFAMNYIFPNKLAVLATADNLNKLAADKNRQLRVREKIESAESKTISQLHNRTIIIKASSSAKGTLFKSVSKTDIIAEAERQLKASLDPKLLILNDHLKTLGLHQLTLKGKTKQGILKLNIIKDHEEK